MKRAIGPSPADAAGKYLEKTKVLYP